MSETLTKERPILFSARMVRALLDGRKTQTRRVVKRALVITADDRTGWTDTPCPYGVPGDRLWVKETWCRTRNNVLYRASCCDDKPSANTDDWDAPVVDRWKPSIHMSRRDSRITLEVVGVRVEAVEEISEADAIAEGFAESFDSAGSCHERTTARENFLHLFYDLNRRAPRGTNPWVWVIDFRRVENRA